MKSRVGVFSEIEPSSSAMLNIGIGCIDIYRYFKYVVKNHVVFDT
jgi:hypothetical protein